MEVDSDTEAFGQDEDYLEDSPAQKNDGHALPQDTPLWSSPMPVHKRFSYMDFVQGSQASPGTFRTARTCFASYATAPSGPRFLPGPSKQSRGMSTATTKPFAESVSGSLTFSSQWLDHLRARGMIRSQTEELNWSGRGQHVEYEDQDTIPLEFKGNLGHGASGIVDRVRCRRIDLARKTIQCSRRLTKEEAVTEVWHLQRLGHRHIVQLVGTYTQKKKLTILLYPAADQNLEKYMDDLLDDTLQLPLAAVQTLNTFVVCLTNAFRYIHSMNVKHMDVKPQNLLVRMNGFRSKIYVADFGIARAYKCAKDSCTDSPTPFTRLYAAPEVIAQEPRDFQADIFSLGCVYMEMLAAIMSRVDHDEREELRKARSSTGDATYSSNVDSVVQWYERVRCHKTRRARFPILVDTWFNELIDNDYIWTHVSPTMLDKIPRQRPTAYTLWSNMADWGCGSCFKGPEPFEAA